VSAGPVGNEGATSVSGRQLLAFMQAGDLSIETLALSQERLPGERAGRECCGGVSLAPDASGEETPLLGKN